MKYILIIILALVLVGCDEIPRFKESEIKEETAEVITMSYVPERSTTTMSPGIDMDGDLVLTMSSHTYPEIYAVTMRCSEHNDTFTLQSKILFKKVKQGDIVTLRYIDAIRYYVKTHRSKNSDGRYVGKPWKSIESEEIVGHHTKQILFKDETKLDR